MKKLFALLFLLSGAFAVVSAQEKVMEISGNGFSRITASNSFEVKVTEGDSPCVKVFADQNIRQYLDIRVENGQLFLGVSKDGITSKVRRTLRIDRIYAEVTVPEITEISISGTASVEFSGSFNTDSFTANINGAGTIRNLDISARTSSFNISGTTRVLGTRIKSGETEMNISGGSETECSLDAQKARIKLSGTIILKCDGYARDMNLKSSGASIIQQKEHALMTGSLNISLNGVTNCGLIYADTLSASLSGTSKARVCVSEKISSVNLSGASTLLYSSPEGSTPEIPSLSDISVSRASLFRKE